MTYILYYESKSMTHKLSRKMKKSSLKLFFEKISEYLLKKSTVGQPISKRPRTNGGVVDPDEPPLEIRIANWLPQIVLVALAAVALAYSSLRDCASLFLSPLLEVN